MILKKFPKKSLGQNFLIDSNVIKKIINIPNSLNNKIVLEIGAGKGNLTSEILKRNPKKIIAVEKDEHLSIFLKQKFSNEKNVNIINKDILDILKKKDLDKDINQLTKADWQKQGLADAYMYLIAEEGKGRRL